MPTYDFRCAQGHAYEARVPYSTTRGVCPDCGGAAQREFVPAHIHVTGFAIPPMKERGIPLSRFTEAQGEMVHRAEKAGKAAPDVLGIARRQASEIRRHAPELITGT